MFGSKELSMSENREDTSDIPRKRPRTLHYLCSRKQTDGLPSTFSPHNIVSNISSDRCLRIEASTSQIVDDLSIDERLSQISIDNELPLDDPLDIDCNKRQCLDGTYFKVVKDQSQVDGTIRASCMICPKEKIIAGTLRSTSNWTTHLKRRHPEEYVEYTQYSLSKRLNEESKNRKRWSCTFSQSTFNLNVTNYILDTMAPLSTVEKKSFRKMFDDLNIKKDGEILKHLTRHSLSKSIISLAERQIAELREMIAPIEYVCTAADAWPGKNRRFIGVTLHWLHPNTLNRKSVAIACRRFPGTHSHEAIAKYLSEIHLSFNLTPKKVVATITDNGSNFVKAFKEYGIDAADIIPTEGASDQSSEADSSETLMTEETNHRVTLDADFGDECRKQLPQHLRCASHTLNLIATTDTIKIIETSRELSERHKNVIAKCTSLWKSLRSPKTSESMKDYLDISLRRPVVTRWNSLFDCLKQLINCKGKLLRCAETAEGISLRDPFNRYDFQYLEEYITCTEDLAKSIDLLQRDIDCYYGYLLPTLLSLRRKMILLEGDRIVRVCQPLVKGTIRALEVRFEQIFDVSNEGVAAAIAAVSHPKFKIRWFRCFSSEIQKRIYNEVLDAASMTSSRDIPACDRNLSEPADGFDFGDGESVFQDLETGINHGAAEIELTRFLQDPDMQLTMLKKYPLIKKVFIKFNTALPSSAPVERLFSYATMIDLPKYNRLSDNQFERRVLLKANSWYNYNDRSEKKIERERENSG